MKEVDNLYKEMQKLAGEDLASKIMSLWENNKDVAAFWFFKPKFSLGNKSPADYCVEGKQEEMKRYVGQLEHTVYP